MKLPVEKSIYRKVYLQLRTGFLSERPLFYDAVRLNPPPSLTRSSSKLPNLSNLEDQLVRNFIRRHPYHFEDFVSKHYESTQYVAYNFAKKQAALMRNGLSQSKAYDIVEREFIAERDAIISQIDPSYKEYPNMKKELDDAASAVVEEKDKKKEENAKSELTQDDINEVLKNVGISSIENIPKLSDEEIKQLENEVAAIPTATDDNYQLSDMEKAIMLDINKQKYDKIHDVVNRTVDAYKRQHGNYIIAQKLKALEEFRKENVSKASDSNMVATKMEGVNDDENEEDLLQEKYAKQIKRNLEEEYAEEE